MEETAVRDHRRLAELEKLIEEMGVEPRHEIWNYTVNLIDHEGDTHEEAKVAMRFDENLIREYAKLLLADHGYRYHYVEVRRGDHITYKDFRYD